MSRRRRPGSNATRDIAEAGFSSHNSNTSVQARTALDLSQVTEGISSCPMVSLDQTANRGTQAGSEGIADEQDGCEDHGNSKIRRNEPDEKPRVGGGGPDDPDGSDSDLDGRRGGRPRSRAATPEERTPDGMPLGCYEVMRN